MDIKRVNIDKVAIALSVIVISFFLFLIFCLIPAAKKASIEQQKDALTIMSWPLVIFMIVAVLSNLILPAYIFRKNTNIFQHRWIMFMVVILVYLLGLSFILAIICLSLYLMKKFSVINNGELNE